MSHLHLRLVILSALFTSATAMSLRAEQFITDTTRHKAVNFVYDARAYTYFDNLEFGSNCPYTQSQTMAGIRLSPEIGIVWGPFKLSVGAHAQKRFGTKRFIDDFDFTAYFRYREQRGRVHHDFLMGAFPRGGLIDEYHNLYFRDSINYRRPNLNGIYYNIRGRHNYLSLWLDWTGWQSSTERETFFVGLSGMQRAGRWFVAELMGYYFHYANTTPRSGDGCVHDNAQAQLTAGIDICPGLITSRRADDRLLLKAGLMFGYERKRDDVTPAKTPLGLIAELNAQIWHVGTHTIYYYGQPRQTVETDVHTATYWGNPLLQSKSYLQSLIYYQLFNRQHVSARIGWTFHLVGTKLYHQQSLHLNVNL